MPDPSVAWSIYGSSQLTWYGASYHCLTLAKGGKKGWRKPTVEVLAILVDPTQKLALPSGHPFENVQLSIYWSASAHALGATYAWAVNFSYGGVGSIDKSGNNYVWCVRGGA